MQGKDLQKLNRGDQILSVRGNIASAAVLYLSKLIYAVVKVLKSSN